MFFNRAYQDVRGSVSERDAVSGHMIDHYVDTPLFLYTSGVDPEQVALLTIPDGTHSRGWRQRWHGDYTAVARDTNFNITLGRQTIARYLGFHGQSDEVLPAAERYLRQRALDPERVAWRSVAHRAHLRTA